MSKNSLSLATIKGQLIAFTYWRLTKDDVIDGLYKYDIQSTDDGFDPSMIGKHIFVNHWGSLFSKDPLPLDSNGYLELDENDFIELLHPPITKEDFKALTNKQVEELLKQESEVLQYESQSMG